MTDHVPPAANPDCPPTGSNLKNQYLAFMQSEEQRGKASRALAAGGRALGLLDWGLRYLPNHFRRPPSKMHRWLAERLGELRTARGVKLNVLGPRGGAKSTLVTLAYVLRAAVEGSEPYIWIVSDTKHQAVAHLENIKSELADNHALAADYPLAVQPARVWRDNAIWLPSGVAIEALGTGQRIRGRRRRADRPTLIVCDDLEDDRHAESAMLREYSRNWFHGMLMKAGTKRTNVVNLATALHRDALALKLHRTPGWTSRIFAAIERWPERMDLWDQWEQLYSDFDAQRRTALRAVPNGAVALHAPADGSAIRPTAAAAAREFYETHRSAMDAGAELLWPEEEDLYTLMAMRLEGGRTAFEREKQNVPLNPALCEWPPAYFSDAIWFDTWPADLQVRVIALDPSKGLDARRGDYSAFILLAIDAASRLFVEADLGRRPTPQIVADGVELCRRFRPDVLGIEANQFQELLGDQFAAELARQGLVHLAPVGIDNRVNKQTRIRRIGPLLAKSRLRFRSNSPGTRLLVQQLQEFPVADHDDGPDALEMAVRLAGDWLDRSRSDDGLGDRWWLSV